MRFHARPRSAWPSVSTADGHSDRLCVCSLVLRLCAQAVQITNNLVTAKRDDLGYFELWLGEYANDGTPTLAHK